MLKKKLVFVLLMFNLFNLTAQVNQGIKLRIEPGVLMFSDIENLGLLLNIEPKLEISDNTDIGMRFGVVLNAQQFKKISSDFFLDDESDNAVISFTPTFDYYLNNDKHCPYLGLGLRYYVFSYVDLLRRNGSSEELEGSMNNKIGLLLRGGFESGKTRVGLEYNFIPKADIEIQSGEKLEQLVVSISGSVLDL